MGANMKHYTEDGLYDGPKHKMDDGTSHTGKTHTKTSKPISHNKKGPFTMKGSAFYGMGNQSPMYKKNKAGKEQGIDGKACWDGYTYMGTKDGKDICK